MTYVLELVVFGAAGEVADHATRSYKTLAGATSAGIRLLGKMHKRTFYGYFAANRYEGEPLRGRRIVAEWRDGATLLGKVWV